MKKYAPMMFALTLVALVGVLVGTMLPRPRAEAQGRQWRECFAATLWESSGRQMASPGFRPRVVSIPPGWTPVGGGAAQSPYVVLCR